MTKMHVALTFVAVATAPRRPQHGCTPAVGAARSPATAVPGVPLFSGADRHQVGTGPGMAPAFAVGRRQAATDPGTPTVPTWVLLWRLQPLLGWMLWPIIRQQRELITGPVVNCGGWDAGGAAVAAGLGVAAGATPGAAAVANANANACAAYVAAGSAYAVGGVCATLPVDCAYTPVGGTPYYGCHAGVWFLLSCCANGRYYSVVPAP